MLLSMGGFFEEGLHKHFIENIFCAQHSYIFLLEDI